MKVSQGEVVWVQYPFSDNPRKYKYRPALVISNAKANRIDNDVVLLPITSSLKNDEFSFFIENNHLQDGQMPKASEVRCNKPTTIRIDFIIGHLNNLTDQALASVLSLLQTVFEHESAPFSN